MRSGRTAAFQNYVEYWQKNSDINQLKRDDFIEYYDHLAQNNIASEKDRNLFDDIIMSKKYPTLNICPGFLIKYTWNQTQAIALENKKAFEEDFRNKIHAILQVFE